MMKRVILAFAVVAAMLPGQARADERWTYAEVVCGKGVALVRFTTYWNDDPPKFDRLPRSVDPGLSARPASRREDCTMTNGWTVRVRSGDKQAFAYGMGGADPPAFFSLWIAQRKVFSRKEWKPGYGSDDESWLAAVVIRPDRMTLCRASEKKKLNCRNQPLRLDRYKVDPIEYAKPGTRPPVGTMQVLPGSPAPQVCREYLRIRGKDWPDSYMLVDSAKIFGPRDTDSDPPLAEATIEIAPGVRRKLINWSADNHYFDGDLMFVAPVSADPRAVLKPEMLDDSTHFPAEKLPAGWYLISGQRVGLYPDVSWRYVHFDTQKIRGRIYLLAQPTNQDERPTAILVQPMASGYRIVCRFQRVEPNF